MTNVKAETNDDFLKTRRVVNSQELINMLPGNILYTYTDVFNPYRDYDYEADVYQHQFPNGVSCYQLVYDKEYGGCTLIYIVNKKGEVTDLIDIGYVGKSTPEKSTYALGYPGELPEFGLQTGSDCIGKVDDNQNTITIKRRVNLMADEAGDSYTLYDVDLVYKVDSKGKLKFVKFIDNKDDFDKLISDYELWYQWLRADRPPTIATKRIVYNESHSVILSRPMSMGSLLVINDLGKVIEFFTDETDTAEPANLNYNYEHQISLFPDDFVKKFKSVSISDAKKFKWLGDASGTGAIHYIKDKKLRDYIFEGLKRYSKIPDEPKPVADYK